MLDMENNPDPNNFIKSIVKSFFEEARASSGSENSGMDNMENSGDTGDSNIPQPNNVPAHQPQPEEFFEEIAVAEALFRGANARSPTLSSPSRYSMLAISSDEEEEMDIDSVSDSSTPRGPSLVNDLDRTQASDSDLDSPYFSPNISQSCYLPKRTEAVQQSAASLLPKYEEVIYMEAKEKNRPCYLEKCGICQEPADFACKGCYRIAYCSEEHQQEGWEQHREDCVHFGLAHSYHLKYRGPFLIHSLGKTATNATESLQDNYRLRAKFLVKPKEKIFEEKPFLVCPWPRLSRRNERHLQPGLTVRNLSCFGCGKALGFSWYQCVDCKLFLCSSDCVHIFNHKNSECKLIHQLTTTNNAKNVDPRLNVKTLHLNEDYREFLYMDVMIIRLLLKLKEIRESLSAEQFAEEWAKLDLTWKSIPFNGNGSGRQVKVVKNMKTLLSFSYMLLKGNEALLWKLFSIIDMNSFLLELPFRRFRALCRILGLATHSCTPNCHVYLQEPDSDKMDVDQLEEDPNELTVIMRCGKEIAQGASISFSYVPLVLGTAERHELLMTTHYLWCQCLRCMDTTESGTFATNIKCPSCQNRMLTPKSSVVETPIPKMGLSTAKPRWECRGPSLVARKSTSAFNRTPSRTCPPLTNESALAKLKGVESALLKLTVEKFAALKEMFFAGRTENSYFYMSAMARMSEDIIRGTFYPLPDILADDLTEYTDDTLLVIVLAKSLYADFMRKVNPGFDFEGFPIANLQLVENELMGRESGRTLYTRAANLDLTNRNRTPGISLRAIYI